MMVFPEISFGVHIIGPFSFLLLILFKGISIFFNALLSSIVGGAMWELLDEKMPFEMHSNFL